MVRHSQRKKPALAMPSTITIIPATKMMVSQLIPLELLSPELIQKFPVMMVFRFSVSIIACGLFMHTPKTMMSVAAAHPRVM